MRESRSGLLTLRRMDWRPGLAAWGVFLNVDVVHGLFLARWEPVYQGVFR
jgi:hypothetical protein